MSKRIWIDAGHGGRDPGAVGPTGLTEAEVVLDVALRLSARLKRHGLAVGMSRHKDLFIPLGERASMANHWDADLFVSLHCNSAETPAMGIETWIARRTKVSFAPADAIQEELAQEFPETTDRGVKRANFTVLTNTRMAAVLVELQFIHVPCGEALLGDPEVRERKAKAVELGVLDYFGMSDPPQDMDPPEPLVCDPMPLIDTVRIAHERLGEAIRAFEKGGRA